MPDEIVHIDQIQNCIYTIRGVQVMLDSDLAKLYRIETKMLNRAVKRNIERFPEEFMFRLTNREWEILRRQVITSSEALNSLRYQNGTLNNQRGKHRKYLPYVFTEQGVAMLSAVLRSETAIKVSIRIMEAFVAMRRFLINNAQIFQKIDTLERRQLKLEIETGEKFEKVFNALQSKTIKPKQGIFFKGQIFDAHKFVSDLVRQANKSLLLIDNYIDETVLDLFSKKKEKVKVTILTNKVSKALLLDVKKFNTQYPPLELIKFSLAHDRFLIIDSKDVYHFGASLKDLGKKWFAFSKMDKTALSLLEKLKKTGVKDPFNPAY